MSDKLIALDFDGVLHKYSHGWDDGTIYDPPVEGAVEACNDLLDKGYSLIIFTARKNIWDIHDWLKYYEFPYMEVTNKKPPAYFYIDDRAIRFNAWDQTLSDIETLNNDLVSKP